ncbi:MAG TPA: FAD:protein FMN transferase [Burkholderiales bacterium]|nr:FAD:protein FMN transferase [Burkholderiales bacterium]
MPDALELRRARPLLGTLVEIAARASEPEPLACAIEAAFATVAQVHRLMSFHARDSDVSRLNRWAWRTALRVHPWTYAVLQEAQRVARASGGLFDVSVARILVARRLLPAPRGARVPDRRACCRDIRLLSGFRVRFDRPLLLDLGGIAKGFAVDRAVQRLRSAGVESALVNAGGDLRCFGAAVQRVHVRDPRAPWRLLPLAELSNGAIATSAAYFTRQRRAGRDVCAQVDPRGGRGVPAGSVSVAARRCITADAWTKVLLLGGARFLGRARRAGAIGRLLG